MSDSMTFSIFAKAWLEQNGLFDKDSDYDGWLGQTTIEVIELIGKQGHSGGSASRLFAILQAIHEAYETPDHPIWQSYWESDEGKRLKAQFIGNLLVPDPPQVYKEMPDPMPEQLDDPVFNAIWNVIKTWDVSAPDYYFGYCGANGSHVMLIVNALKELHV